MTTLLAKKACFRCLHTCQQVTAFCVWLLSLRVHYGFVSPFLLAHMLYSLVRVSRRDDRGLPKQVSSVFPKNSYVCGLFPACISSRHYSYLHHLTAASSLVVPSLYAKSALLSISLCFLFHSFPPLCQLFLLPFYLMISSLPCMFLDNTLLEYPLPLTRPFFHLGLLTATSTHPVSSCLHPPIRSLWPISHSVV